LISICQSKLIAGTTHPKFHQPQRLVGAGDPTKANPVVVTYKQLAAAILVAVTFAASISSLVVPCVAQTQASVQEFQDKYMYGGVTAVATDQIGNVWTVTWEDGNKRGSLHRITPDSPPGKFTSDWWYPLDALAGIRLFDIEPDSAGRTWFSSPENGFLGWLDTSGNQVINYFTTGSYPANGIHWRSDTLWYTSTSGTAVISVKPSDPKGTLYPVKVRVLNMAFDSAGNIWFTADDAKETRIFKLQMGKEIRLYYWWTEKSSTGIAVDSKDRV
jgi:streptogramin lyase